MTIIITIIIIIIIIIMFIAIIIITMVLIKIENLENRNTIFCHKMVHRASKLWWREASCQPAIKVGGTQIQKGMMERWMIGWMG